MMVKHHRNRVHFPTRMPISHNAPADMFETPHCTIRCSVATMSCCMPVVAVPGTARECAQDPAHLAQVLRRNDWQRVSAEYNGTQRLRTPLIRGSSPVQTCETCAPPPLPHRPAQRTLHMRHGWQATLRVEKLKGNFVADLGPEPEPDAGRAGTCNPTKRPGERFRPPHATAPAPSLNTRAKLVEPMYSRVKRMTETSSSCC